MTVSHALLVCTDDNNGKYVKMAGHLALALASRGVKISILSSVDVDCPFDGISKDISVYHTTEHKWKLPWMTDLSASLKHVLKQDSSIDLVHTVGVNAQTVSVSKVCESLGVPVIGTAMSADDFRLKNLPVWKRKGYVKHLDAYNHIVVSSQIMLEEANILHLDNVSYISEGVDTERFKPVLSKRPIRRELDLPVSSTLVCCMADIEPGNKQLELIKTCMPLSDLVQVLFIGKVVDKAYMELIREELRRTATEPYVIFKDAVLNPEDYLKACDVFMLLGGVEQRQSTVLEAQSCGLPVVLEASDSALTLTNGNKTGIVAYPNNALVKEGVEKILNDPNFRQGRALYARPFVKKEHDFNQMIQSYLIVYQKL